MLLVESVDGRRLRGKKKEGGWGGRGGGIGGRVSKLDHSDTQ